MRARGTWWKCYGMGLDEWQGAGERGGGEERMEWVGGRWIVVRGRS